MRPVDPAQGRLLRPVNPAANIRKKAPLWRSRHSAIIENGKTHTVRLESGAFRAVGQRSPISRPGTADSTVSANRASCFRGMSSSQNLGFVLASPIIRAWSTCGPTLTVNGLYRRRRLARCQIPPAEFWGASIRSSLPASTSSTGRSLRPTRPTTREAACPLCRRRRSSPSIRAGHWLGCAVQSDNNFGPHLFAVRCDRGHPYQPSLSDRIGQRNYSTCVLLFRRPGRRSSNLRRKSTGRRPSGDGLQLHQPPIRSLRRTQRTVNFQSLTARRPESDAIITRVIRRVRSLMSLIAFRSCRHVRAFTTDVGMARGHHRAGRAVLTPILGVRGDGFSLGTTIRAIL